jgi:AraC-like DNA-binding protein
LIRRFVENFVMNDRLAALLRRFPLNVAPFGSPGLPALISTDTEPPAGWLHLLLRGPLQIEASAADASRFERLQLLQPALIWLPAPTAHRLTAMSERGATVLCSAVRFGDPTLNPLATALPALMAVTPREMPRPMASAWALVIGEYEAGACAHGDALRRLAELLLLHLLRRQLDAARRGIGLLAALSDDRLLRVLDAMHDHPERPWTLEILARQAGLSRTALAERFRDIAGTTPMDYLTDWRLRLARERLGQGHTLASTAAAIGYSSPAALSRVFLQRLGKPPGAWQPTTS